MPAGTALASVLESAGSLSQRLDERLGIRPTFFASSGRAALTILLKALQQRSDRREVVIPAYTCFSVPSAVARAGLVIRLCDVDPKTLDLDLNALARLDLSRVLCIVPSGLYGPTRVSRRPRTDCLGLRRLPRGRHGPVPGRNEGRPALRDLWRRNVSVNPGQWLSWRSQAGRTSRRGSART
jgi:DegT/DnrJ/EryC1/StrS aminotransferase family